jgi:iron uptake system EfeUOB component EfeO/EfeM
MRVRPAALIILGAALLAGCGGGGREEPADPGALPVSASATNAGLVPRARPADFKGPIATYRSHVGRELAAMQIDAGQLAAATSTGDLAAAKRAWLAADARYETIGAAYGAFGNLDAAINGTPGGLGGGERSRRFTGLHRIELALWGHGSTAEARPYAERLSGDVARLRSKLPRIEIDPTDYSLRAHEVLEDTLNLQLSGRASPWAGAALVALRSNIEGTEVVLRTLRPMVRRRNPDVLYPIDRSIRQLRRTVAGAAQPDGTLPRWDALPQRQRELIYGRTAAAAERLAYVPEIADPRPAPTPEPALGAEASQ